MVVRLLELTYGSPDVLRHLKVHHPMAQAVVAPIIATELLTNLRTTNQHTKGSSIPMARLQLLGLECLAK